MSLWELAAVIFAITYVLLAVRENVLCWLFAFVSTAIYTVLFWDVSLLMDSALNVYYMAMAVYGWLQWTRGGTNVGEEPLTTYGPLHDRPAAHPGHRCHRNSQCCFRLPAGQTQHRCMAIC